MLKKLLTGTIGALCLAAFAGGLSAQTLLDESFDGVVAPALPSGWVAAAGPGGAGSAAAWASRTANAQSAPNSVFANDVAGVSDQVLTTPTITLGTGTHTLTFDIAYNNEDGFDGCILEIDIGVTGTFQDIIVAGGTFNSGAYSTNDISLNFSSPIAGQFAWTGDSAGYVSVDITLPAGASGGDIQLRWRQANDSSVSDVGTDVDNVLLVGPTGPTPTPPTITSAAPTAATVGNAYSYTITATGSPAPTFTISPDPATIGSGWLTWNGTDTLSGTPAAGDVGTPIGPLTITATNGASPDDTETFTVTVTQPAPEIDILDPGSSSVASGDTLDVFGSVAGMSTTGTFTIENNGTADLNLTGTPDLIAQSGATNCTLVITQPTVNPITAGNSDTFGLDVQPTAAGAWSVTITIANNDSDEGTYTITLQGTAQATAEPEIGVLDPNDVAIADGGTYSVTNTGTAMFNSAWIVRNEGAAALNLTGTTAVAISGTPTNCSVTINQPASTTLAAATGGATEEAFSFDITPTAAGAFSFTFVIASNDTDEPTYTVTFNGDTSTPSGGGGGGGGGGDDGGGCTSVSTTSYSWLLLLAAFGLVAVATRLRNSRA